MKLINNKINLSIDECKKIVQAESIYSDTNLNEVVGIHWIKSKNILFYYEDGSKGSTGALQLLKTIFYGRLKSSNGGT